MLRLLMIPVLLAAAVLALFASICSAGTVQLALNLNRIGPSMSSNPNDLVAIGSTLFFVADDGVHGQELWKTDGTGFSTKVIDLQPGARGSNPSLLTAVGNSLYFLAFHENRHQVMKLATPVSPPQVIGTLDPSLRVDEDQPRLTLLASDVYLVMCDDAQFGCEVWKVNGSTGNSSMVKDISPGPDSSFPYGLVVYSGLVFYSANDGVHSYECDLYGL